MKILLIGDWHSDLHEEAAGQALEKLGHEVCRFGWCRYFRHLEGAGQGAWSLFWSKFQNKFIVGPVIARINRDVVATARSFRPDTIFVYRGTHLTAATIRKLREEFPAAVLVGYNNDDPFAQGHPFWLWRHFLAAVPEYDLMLAYRHHNLDDFRRIGAREVGLLRSWFIPERNYPVQLTMEERSRFGCDVVFAGHYEDDGRLQDLEAVVQAGFHFRLFGPEWERAVASSPDLCRCAPVEPVRGEDYNRALCGAKIALCFLSTLNRDTYTRRCFEIPATGTFMLAQYSDDLASLYQEGEEAEFFRSREELLEKLRYYLHDEEARQRVAAAGMRKVWASRHDVGSRMSLFVEWTEEIRARKASGLPVTI